MSKTLLTDIPAPSISLLLTALHAFIAPFADESTAMAMPLDKRREMSPFDRPFSSADAV